MNYTITITVHPYQDDTREDKVIYEVESMLSQYVLCQILDAILTYQLDDRLFKYCDAIALARKSEWKDGKRVSVREF